MFIKKSKLTAAAILGMALFTSVAFTSCNNEGEKKEEPAKTEEAAPAPADTSVKPADTTTAPLDTASTRGVKNPG
jgi:PBP1b-binding outer membrane lipoprotein LpoB